MKIDNRIANESVLERAFTVEKATIKTDYCNSYEIYCYFITKEMTW